MAVADSRQLNANARVYWQTDRTTHSQVSSFSHSLSGFSSSRAYSPHNSLLVFCLDIFIHYGIPSLILVRCAFIHVAVVSLSIYFIAQRGWREPNSKIRWFCSTKSVKRVKRILILFLLLLLWLRAIRGWQYLVHLWYLCEMPINVNYIAIWIRE